MTAELSHLAAVRDSYDTVAADYVKRIEPPAEMDPLSRAMLAAFAELVAAADLGSVADLGCGPGRVTAQLTELGVSAFGIDLSPNMIELARRAHPHLRFSVGSMTALALDDDSLGGVLALFSTFHTPPDELPTVFSACGRNMRTAAIPCPTKSFYCLRNASPPTWPTPDSSSIRGC